MQYYLANVKLTL